MMDEWIEVFRAGTWTLSDGVPRTFTAEDLDRLVEATKANLGTPGLVPPAVIGHPELNAPAWGWVADLKRVGGSLFVKFRDVVPEFAAMVRNQMFPNRSIGFRVADWSLIHVGFLGAKAPAVKGLAPIAAHALGGDGITVIECAINETKEASMNLTEKIKQFFGLAEELGATIELPGVAKPDPRTPAPAIKTFSEADIETAVKAAEAKARAEERQKVEVETAAATRKASIATFSEGLKLKGHLIPAWEKAGIRTFMERLAGEEDVVLFAEGAAKQTPVAWFQAFLEGLPKLVTFEEIAGEDGRRKPAATAAEEIKVRAFAAMATNPKLTYGEAFQAITVADRDLAERYLVEARTP